MRNIYLTEEQYVNCVLFEYSKFGEINEAKFDIRKLVQTLYKGCKTFGDYARRTTYIASAGIISLTLLYSIINKCLPVDEMQKQVLIAQVEQTPQTDEKKEVINLNFKISENGLEHIKQYEKCKLKPYFATKKEKEKGIKTIGWGHKIVSTDPTWLKKAESITQAQADELFKQDIQLYENELKEVFKVLPKYLQNVDLYPQGFIDACISIIYNSGRKNLKLSPFFQALSRCRIDKDGNINKSDYIFVCAKIKESCIKQEGVVVNGLVRRRNTESLMAQQ